MDKKKSVLSVEMIAQYSLMEDRKGTYETLHELKLSKLRVVNEHKSPDYYPSTSSRLSWWQQSYSLSKEPLGWASKLLIN